MTTTAKMDASHWRPWDHSAGAAQSGSHDYYAPQFVETSAIRVTREANFPHPLATNMESTSGVITSPEQHITSPEQHMETVSTVQYTHSPTRNSWQHERRHSISSAHGVITTPRIVQGCPSSETSPAMDRIDAERSHSTSTGKSPHNLQPKEASKQPNHYQHQRQYQSDAVRPHPYHPSSHYRNGFGVEPHENRVRSISTPGALRSPISRASREEYYSQAHLQPSPLIQGNGHLYSPYHPQQHWDASRRNNSYHPEDGWHAPEHQHPHYSSAPPSEHHMRSASMPSSHYSDSTGSHGDHYSSRDWVSGAHGLRQPSNAMAESLSSNSRRKKPPISRPDRPCLHCGTHESCTWRPGPTGSGTLCNTCGYFYRRHGRLNAKRKSLLVQSQDNANNHAANSEP